VQVLRYSDGAHVRTIGSECSGNGQFKYTSGIAVGGEGDIAIFDGGNARVRVHRLSDGAYIRTIGSRCSGNGQFAGGCLCGGGVAFDSEGNLVVADPGNHRVQVQNTATARMSAPSAAVEQAPANSDVPQMSPSMPQVTLL
jgi:hypothetical protein